MPLSERAAGIIISCVKIFWEAIYSQKAKKTKEDPIELPSDELFKIIFNDRSLTWLLALSSKGIHS